jgi:hypothetical protein
VRQRECGGRDDQHRGDRSRGHQAPPTSNREPEQEPERECHAGDDIGEGDVDPGDMHRRPAALVGVVGAAAMAGSGRFRVPMSRSSPAWPVTERTISRGPAPESFGEARR